MTIEYSHNKYTSKDCYGLIIVWFPIIYFFDDRTPY